MRKGVFSFCFCLLVFLIPQGIQKIQLCRFHWYEKNFTPAVIYFSIKDLGAGPHIKNAKQNEEKSTNKYRKAITSALDYLGIVYPD